MRDSEYARSVLAELRPVYPPGTLHMYHGLTWGPIVRELVAAATGRSIRDIAADGSSPVPLSVEQLRRRRIRRSPRRTEPPPARQAPVCSTRASGKAVGGSMEEIILSPTAPST